MVIRSENCEIEKKKCSFNNADFGIIALETTFPICNSVLNNHVSIEKIVELLSVNPRKILNIPHPKIELNKIFRIDNKRIATLEIFVF